MYIQKYTHNPRISTRIHTRNTQLYTTYTPTCVRRTLHSTYSVRTVYVHYTYFIRKVRKYTQTQITYAHTFTYAYKYKFNLPVLQIDPVGNTPEK